VNGSWRIVEASGENAERGEWRDANVQPSFFMFMDGHYSMAYVGGGERRPLMPEDASRGDLTADQVASIWLPYVSNSGNYEITSSTLTTRPVVALFPNFMEGGSQQWSYSREGARLRLSRSAEGFSEILILERVR